MKPQTICTLCISLVTLWLLVVQSSGHAQGAPNQQVQPAIASANLIEANAHAGITAPHKASWDEYSETRDFTDGYLAMGQAWGDYDNDGRVDFVTGDWNQGYVLYHNLSKAGAEHNWFATHLVGDGPVNRDAAGARLYLTDSNGKTQLRDVRIASSLGAGEETVLYFGLGTATIAEASVAWPDGTSVTFPELPINERWYLTYPDQEGMNVADKPVALTQPTVTPTTAPVVATQTPTVTTMAVAEATPTTLPTPTAQVPIPAPTQVAAMVPTTQSSDMPAPTAATYPTVAGDDALLATAWFDLYLELIETTSGFTPPVAARAIGYGGVTLYEALVPGLPGYQSLVGQLNGLTSLPTPQQNMRYHWPTVANSAMANITRMLFANTTALNKSAIGLLELQIAERYRPLLDAATFNRSTQYGRAVAVAIYGWSVTDGGHEGELHNFPDGHTTPVGVGLWESTPPGYAAALQPYWGNNRPMALRLDHSCVAAPPAPYSEDPSSTFYALAQEVYDTVRLITPEQRVIARFWADDTGTTPTPPGHSLSVATQLLRQTDASLALAAETYARVGIALNDAFIGCWQTKFQYNRIRPITFIHRQIDPTWNDPDVTDPVLTPPFPEYTSGHSVQSGAVAEVLTSLFGTVPFTDRTHVARGLLPRTYRSFWEMANEAAISRLYGGIHYRDAIDEGLVQGQCIGQQVVALQFRAE